MYARRVLGDRSDAAEDVVQEAYLRLLGLAASDESPSSARPWLFRVVRNLAIDERRSAARRPDPVADTAILGAAALDDTPGLVEHREEIAGALRDIAALPPRERRALEMDQAGIGAQTIAAELGTTPNAVHQALFRARKRLRNARAVAWGLIPVGLIPLALRASDPALAVAAGNLPPGMPMGRALPVAGLVAAAMVGGSVVAPDIDSKRGEAPAAQAIAKTIAAQRIAVTDDAGEGSPTVRTVNGTRGSSTNSDPGSSSGKGKAGNGDGEDDEDTNRQRGRNRGSGDDDGDDDRMSGDRDRRRGKGSGPSESGSSGGGSSSGGDDRDDDAPSRSRPGSRSGKGSSGSDSSGSRGSGSGSGSRSGSGARKESEETTAPKPPPGGDAPDAPGEPVAPDND
jgi:RNA polymerase sigma factor (sigma-70 family)